VPGKLAATDTVLVDVGTGFYVEKVGLFSIILSCHSTQRNAMAETRKYQTPPAAQDFYKRKVEELGKNLVDLEKIVQGKQRNLGVVEDGESLSFQGADRSEQGCSWGRLTGAVWLVLRQKVIESSKGGGEGGT